MNRSRIVAVVFAALLVTASLGGPVSQDARAWEMGTQGECDGTDFLLSMAANGGLIGNQILSGDCALRFSDDEDATTDLDHYQQGVSYESQSDGFLTSYENFGQDTRSVAWSKAKITIVNSMNDGNTSSATKTLANETVDDYYSQQQAEIVRQWDRVVRSAEYTWSATNGSVTFNNNQLAGFATVEVELYNGTTMWTRVPVDDTNGADIPLAGLTRTGNNKNHTGVSSNDDGSYWNSVERDDNNLEWVDPDGSDNARPIGNNRLYNLGNDISSQRAQVKDNIDQYVDGVYTDYQEGELNTTDVADPTTLAGQAATEYNDSGYYSFASISLASLGYAGNMNSSVTVSTANGTVDGTLFYTADDLDGFTVGETYDPSTLNGTVYMAVQEDDNNGTVRILDDTFTIESATNPETGESMDNVSVEEYTYDSTNSSELASELDRLSELRQEYEDMSSGGSGGGDSGASSNLLLVLLAGAAGAAILMGRNGGGGRRGRR